MACFRRRYDASPQKALAYFVPAPSGLRNEAAIDHRDLVSDVGHLRRCQEGNRLGDFGSLSKALHRRHLCDALDQGHGRGSRIRHLYITLNSARADGVSADTVGRLLYSDLAHYYNLGRFRSARERAG